jgi:hypothetical protein
MKSFACLVALMAIACTGDSRVGRMTGADAGGGGDAGGGADAGGGPDAGVDAGSELDAGDEPLRDASTEPDAAACMPCEASSCGTRICGRSECGYLCGVCGSGSWCFRGTACGAGTGPGEPCIEPWGTLVHEGDQGFRSCPTGPGVQRCTCGGGGPDACTADPSAPCIVPCSGDATIALGDASVYGSCMPVTPPDPIMASWTIAISGATGSTATLRDARLRIVGSHTVMQTLTVDPMTIALTGGSGTAMQSKTGADTDPSMPCGELCGGATYTLELTYEVDGAEVRATESGFYSCVF